eukprot:gnl/Chilomastix_cuspidata/2700.p1 GENE.gnl/Chilomastix_cuspidata/2700~~gnl/Chilomastix_cuspidata/2700.p1  ORF type:complete len:1711 (+),score=581.63 gnl/Chilomastix_cuspidata/2700:809-5941(+)
MGPSSRERPADAPDVRAPDKDFHVHPLRSSLAGTLDRQDIKTAVKFLRNDLKRLPRRRTVVRPNTMWRLILDRASWVMADRFERSFFMREKFKAIAEEAAKVSKDRISRISHRQSAHMQQKLEMKSESEKALAKLLTKEIFELQLTCTSAKRIKYLIKTAESELQRKLEKINGTLDKTQAVLKTLRKRRRGEWAAPDAVPAAWVDDGPRAANTEQLAQIGQRLLAARRSKALAQPSGAVKRRSSDAAKIQRKKSTKGVFGTADAPPTQVTSEPAPLVMRDYQEKGVDALLTFFKAGANGILADETGLGKTVQIVSFIARLKGALAVEGPCLVVTAQQSLNRWRRQFELWAPGLAVVIYSGTTLNREAQYERWNKSDSKSVLVTSYKDAVHDVHILRQYQWAHAAVEFGWKLNTTFLDVCEALSELQIRRSVLVTGVDPGECGSELLYCLHFLFPDFFKGRQEVAALVKCDYSTKNRSREAFEAVLANARQIIQPFLIRRTRQEVHAQLPSRIELNIICPLAPRQAALVAHAAPCPLAEGEEAAYLKGVAALVMQHQKICNHPSLVANREPVHPFIVPAWASPVLYVGAKLLHVQELFAEANWRDRTFTSPLLVQATRGPRSVCPTCSQFLSRVFGPLFANIERIRGTASFTADLLPKHIFEAATSREPTLSFAFGEPEFTEEQYFRKHCQDPLTEGALDAAGLPLGYAISCLNKLDQYGFDAQAVEADTGISVVRKASLQVVLETYMRSLQNFQLTLEASRQRLFSEQSCAALASPVPLSLYYQLFDPRVAFGLCFFAAELSRRGGGSVDDQKAPTRFFADAILSARARLRRLAAHGSATKRLLLHFVQDSSVVSPLDAMRLRQRVLPGFEERFGELLWAPAVSPYSAHIKGMLPLEKTSPQALQGGYSYAPPFIAADCCISALDIAWKVSRFTGSNLLRTVDPMALGRASGKMVILERLLACLRAQGRRCVLFSQMATTIDLLELWADTHGYRYERLGGACPRPPPGDTRAPPGDSRTFLYLVSTRTTNCDDALSNADSVIFFDIDWNDKMQENAQKLSEKIGNTKDVLVFYLIAKDTVELLALDDVRRRAFFGGLRERGALASLLDAGPLVPARKPLVTSEKNSIIDMLRAVKVGPVQQGLELSRVTRTSAQQFKERDSGKVGELRAAFQAALAALEPALDRNAARQVSASENQAIGQKSMRVTPKKPRKKPPAIDVKTLRKWQGQLRREHDAMDGARKVLFDNVRQNLRDDPLWAKGIKQEIKQSLKTGTTAKDIETWVRARTLDSECQPSEEGTQRAGDSESLPLDSEKYKTILNSKTTFCNPTVSSHALKRAWERAGRAEDFGTPPSSEAESGRRPRLTYTKALKAFITEGITFPNKATLRSSNLSQTLAPCELFCELEDSLVVRCYHALATRGQDLRTEHMQAIACTANIVSNTLLGRRHSVQAIVLRCRALNVHMNMAHLRKAGACPKRKELLRFYSEYFYLTREKMISRINFLNKMSKFARDLLPHYLNVATSFRNLKKGSSEEPWSSLLRLAENFRAELQRMVNIPPTPNLQHTPIQFTMLPMLYTQTQSRTVQLPPVRKTLPSNPFVYKNTSSALHAEDPVTRLHFAAYRCLPVVIKTDTAMHTMPHLASTSLSAEAPQLDVYEFEENAQLVHQYFTLKPMMSKMYYKANAPPFPSAHFNLPNPTQRQGTHPRYSAREFK